MSKEESILKLKQDLAEFKESAMSKGWEEDEVDEKVKEAVESNDLYFVNLKISEFQLSRNIVNVNL